MVAVAALLSLCFGGLPPCPSGARPQCIAELARGHALPWRVAVSRDDTLAAVAAAQTGLHVYNVATGAAVTVPSYPVAYQPAFSRDDKDKVAVALDGRGVAVVSLSSGTELWSDNTKALCRSVAYSPDGTRVASGHHDGNIYIWHAATGALLQPLPQGHNNDVSTLTYTRDGGRLISGSWDGKVIVWDAKTGAQLKVLTDHTSSVAATRVSPDGVYFASLGYGSRDSLNIYTLTDYTLQNPNAIQPHGTDFSFNHDSSKLAVVGHGSMNVYMVDSGSLAQSYTMPTPETYAVSYFHKSDTIITAEWVISNAGIHLWEDLTTPAPPPPCPSAAGPQCITELARGPGFPWRVAVSRDDTLAAVAAKQTGLHVYNVATGAAVTVPFYPVAYQPAFSRNDKDKVAVALGSGGVAVVSLSSGTELWSDNTKGFCRSVAYSPDGRRVASGYNDGKIYIRDAVTGVLLPPHPMGHTAHVSALTYTPDGGRLISGSWDNKVVVWDAMTGAQLKVLTDHSSSVEATRVSPDGVYFASLGYASHDGLNIYTLTDYIPLKHISNAVQAHGFDFSFNHDSSKLAVVGHGRVMKVYTVDGSPAQSYTMPTSETYAVSYFHNSDTIITAEWVISNAGIHLWEDLGTR